MQNDKNNTPLSSTNHSLDDPPVSNSFGRDNTSQEGAGSYSLESLKVKDQNQTSEPNVSPAAQHYEGQSMRNVQKRKALVISTLITLVVLLITLGSLFLFSSNTNQQDNLAQPGSEQDLQLNEQFDQVDIPGVEQESDALLINGDVVTRGIVKFSQNGFVGSIDAGNITQDRTYQLPDDSGVICIDTNNCDFAESDELTTVQGQVGQLLANPNPSSLVNGIEGEVTIQGSVNQVGVASNNGNITISLPQNISQGSSPTFNNLLLNGNLTLGLNCSTFLNGGTLTTNANGRVICGDDQSAGGAGTGVTTAGGTIGSIPMFTASDQIGDSIISQTAGNIINVAGNLEVADTSHPSYLGLYHFSAFNIQKTFNSSDSCFLGCYGNFTTVRADNPSNPNILVGTRIQVGTAASSFTLSNAEGLAVSGITKGSGSTITNTKGIVVGAQTAGINNAGILVGEATGTNQSNLVLGQTSIPSGSYSIYNGSTNQNYFAGNLGIGDNTPTALLTVGASDAFQVDSAGNILTSGTLNVQGNTTIGDASGDTLTVNGSSITLANGFTSCTALNTDGSGVVDCDTNTYLTSANAFIQGGNSFGATATLGTNNNNSLTLETNNTAALTIDTSQNATFAGSVTLAAQQTLSLTGGTTAQRPGSPTEGMLYFDTTTDGLLVYANGKWQGDRAESVIVAASNSTQAQKDSADYVAGGENGDGTTTLDGDQIEINAAINQLSSNGGGKVYLLPGEYNLDDSIKMKSDIVLSGSGNSTIIRSAPSVSSTEIIELSANNGSVNGIKLRDFVAVGSGNSTETIKFSNGSGSSQRIEIENLRVDSNSVGAPSRSISVNSASEVKISNVALTGENGMLLNTVSNAVISDSTFSEFTDTNRTAVHLLNSNNVVVSDNNIYNNTRGVRISSSVNNVVDANTIVCQDDNSLTRHGIYLDSTSISNIISNNNISGNCSESAILAGSDTDNNIITGNYIDADYTAGIHVAGDDSLVSANRVVGLGSYGISVEGSNIKTVNNMISRASFAGVFVLGDEAAVSDNNIYDSFGHGVIVSGSDNSSVSNNAVKNSGGSGSNSGIYVQLSNGLNLVDNRITDSAGTGYAIDISDSASTGTYLAGNQFSGTGASSINDNGTNTIYGGQTNAANDYVIQPQGEIDLNADTNIDGNLVVTGTSELQDQLTFSGVTTDITTGTDEDLTVIANGTGVIHLNDTVQLGSLPGTSDTNALLCLNGNGEIDSCQDATLGGEAFIQGGNSFGQAAVLGTNDTNSLSFETDGTTALTIDTSQNVGIGTTTPGAKLEVSGDIYLSKESDRTIKVANSTTSSTAGAALNILGADGNDASGGAINITGGRGTGFNDGGAVTITGGLGLGGGAATLSGGSGSFVPGSVTVQGGAGSGTDRFGGNTFIDGGQGTGTGSGGSISFRTAPAGSTGSSLNALVTRLQVASTGNITADSGTFFVDAANDRVGVGTTGPGALLHVASNASGDDLLKVTDSTSTARDVLTIADGGATTFRNQTDTVSAFRIQNSTGVDLLNADTSNMTITVVSATVNGILTVNGHIVSGNTSGNTTIAAEVAACTTPTVDLSGNDTAGTITVTTGTGCASTGALATITFSDAYGAAPRVTLTPGNANATVLDYYRGSSTTEFTLETNTVPSDSTEYIYDYQIIE
ncbi:MAG: right-handed parallel beta-helix repeat-containing protein [Candidatus Saccharibacteria bacterium]|nr:right-handed parallel beta-helix repeat-containing protein [Candidatus Saccharibacteria bacterium]